MPPDIQQQQQQQQHQQQQYITATHQQQQIKKQIIEAYCFLFSIPKHVYLSTVRCMFVYLAMIQLTVYIEYECELAYCLYIVFP